MDLAQRINRYCRLETLRRRPLIVYATSTRQGVGAAMAADAVRQFIDQIDAIPADQDSVDVLIHSTGGDPLTAWKLMSILRERFKVVGVLVPYMAFSAATIFALGADEIVMHPHASLGPIDPQITIPQKDGNSRRFSFEDVGAFLRFLTTEVGLTEQSYVASVIDKLFSVVDPVHVGGAKRASELSTDVGERLLQMHMTNHEERNRARAIAEGLNKTFFAHGDAVSRSRARALHLKLAPESRELELAMWEAYAAIESYMQLREPFKPFEYFVAHGGKPAVAPTAPLKVPPNTPPQMVQQLWNQVGQAAIAAMQQPAIEVPFDLTVALVESPRRASEYVQHGTLTAARAGGGEVQMARTDTDSGWRDRPLPAVAPEAQMMGQREDEGGAAV